MPFDSSYRRDKLKTQMLRGLEPPYLCDICGVHHVEPSAPQYDPNSLVIDHIIPTSVNPKLMYELSNLRIAAFRCNNKRSSGEALDIIKRPPGLKM